MSYTPPEFLAHALAPEREAADEEAEHVMALDNWIARTPRPSATWEADPDPPKI